MENVIKNEIKNTIMQKRSLITGEPLVTVIVPVYNTAAYLQQCIDSIRSQTYSNLEIILIDDGSEDGSGSICDGYGQEDSRICVIHQQNSGQSAARNKGIAQARGKYIQFVDSDDWLDIHCIETCVRVCEENNCDLAFFDAMEINETCSGMDGGVHGHKKAYSGTSGIEMFSRLVDNSDFNVSPCLYLVHRSLITENHILFPEGLIYEDTYFTFCVFIYADKAEHVFKRYYFRRVRNHSTMTRQKSSANARSLLEIIRLTAPYYHSGRYRNWHKQIYKYIHYLMALFLDVFIQTDDDGSVIKELYRFAVNNGLIRVPIPADTVILYGYGKRGKTLLGSKLIPEPSEIWDNQAERTGEDFVLIPDYMKLKDCGKTVLVVGIDNLDVYMEVKEAAGRVGFGNVVNWCDYALFYAGK